jgi:parallel beta-helix repeat protein
MTTGAQASVGMRGSKIQDFSAHLADSVLYVTSKGADKTGVIECSASIQSAVNNLINGGVVYFPKGSYKISTPINTIAENTYFVFEKGAKLILSGDDVGGISLNHNNCGVIGGTFVGSGGSSSTPYVGYGVTLLAVDNCIIRDNHFIDISGISIFLRYSEAKGCKNNLIESNIIETPSCTLQDGSGILVGYSNDGYYHEDNIISGNYIDGNNVISNGIALITHAINNIVKDNTVKNCIRYGIVSYESDYIDFTLKHTTIENNRVENIGAEGGSINWGMGIYLAKSHYSTVRNNKIYNALIGNDTGELLPQGAIGLNGCIGCNVTGNQIFDSNLHGIYLKETFETVCNDNFIDGTVKTGIKMTNCNDIEVSENVLKNITTLGIQGVFAVTPVTNPDGYAEISSGKNLSIFNNKIKSPNNFCINFTGLETMLLENISIKNNMIYSNSGFVALTYIKNSEISSNICNTDSSAVGIQVNNALSDHVKVHNNALITVGIFATAVRYQGTNPDIRGNYISNATTYIQYGSENFRNEPSVFYLGSMPATGTWVKGDKVININPVESGTAGSKYVIDHWRRLTTGSSNTLNVDWVAMRCLTGN